MSIGARWREPCFISSRSMWGSLPTGSLWAKIQGCGVCVMARPRGERSEPGAHTGERHVNDLSNVSLEYPPANAGDGAVVSTTMLIGLMIAGRLASRCPRGLPSSSATGDRSGGRALSNDLVRFVFGQYVSVELVRTCPAGSTSARYRFFRRG